jgi:PAS domain-containing protein
MSTTGCLDWLAPVEQVVQVEVLLQIRDREQVFIGLNKSRRSGGFHRDEMALLRQVLPIFKRTIEVGRHVEKLDRERSLKDGLVERVPFGILLVGPDRQIRFMNAAARKIIGAADGLSDKGGKLRLADGTADLALGKLLRLAGAPGGQLRRAVCSKRRAHPAGTAIACRCCLAPMRAPRLRAGWDPPSRSWSATPMPAARSPPRR